MPHPLLKIYTFGEFALERLLSSSTDQHPQYQRIPRAEWNSRVSSMTLLKVLLCRTRRRAHKDVLIEAIWPEEEQSRMKKPEGALNSAATVLRTVLQTYNGESLLLTSQTRDGIVYKLPDQQQVWVDADDFEMQIANATKAERTGGDVFPFWEAAFAHLKGDFLEDDLYADWVQAKRQALDGEKRLCIRRLAALYSARNMRDHAEALLYGFVAANPHDEDAICLLLDLLIQQARWREAQRLYQKTVKALQEEGTHPMPALFDFAEQIQQGQREKSHVVQIMPSVPANPRPVSHDPFMSQAAFEPTILHRSTPPHFSSSPDAAYLMQGASHLGQLFTEGWSMNEILNSLQLVLQGVRGMPEITRRQLLQWSVASIIGNVPVLAGSHVSEEERLRLCESLTKSIKNTWELFHSAGTAQVLAVGQALLALVQQNHAHLPARIRPLYYTSVYNLIGVALHVQGQPQLALDAHMNAYIAALATGDSWYVVQSLLCQINAYHSLNQYNEATQAIEEALRIIGNQTDITYVRSKAHLLGCWADNATMIGEYATAQKHLDLAATFLEKIGPNAEFDYTSWLQLAGNHALATKNYVNAASYFEKALSAPQTSKLREASTSVALAASCLYMDETMSLSILEKNISIIEMVNAPSVNKQLAAYIQQGLLVTSPDSERIKGFVADIQCRIPALRKQGDRKGLPYTSGY